MFGFEKKTSIMDIVQGMTTSKKDELSSKRDNQNIGLENTLTTFSKIEFNKYDLFFNSVPNQVCFDKVKIKNIGTTCIYFKWQKLNKPFNLSDKKSDGIDRFFCHYVNI